MVRERPTTRKVSSWLPELKQVQAQSSKVKRAGGTPALLKCSGAVCFRLGLGDSYMWQAS